MPKAASPVRLDAELMKSAALTGQMMHRSAAQQVEYWADLGQRLADIINPKDLLSISAGLMKLKLEPVLDPIVDPDDVFAELEHDRASGKLRDAIFNGSPRYQASINQPGMLECVTPEGEVIVGQFENGQFVPLSV